MSYVGSYFGSVAKTTQGNYVLLEGRVRRGVFENWPGRFRYRARRFARSTSEAQIVDLVNGSEKVRVFWSGHSFNDGILSEEALVSLDDYSSVVRREL